jgi:tight adherence protein C
VIHHLAGPLAAGMVIALIGRSFRPRNGPRTLAGAPYAHSGAGTTAVPRWVTSHPTGLRRTAAAFGVAVGVATAGPLPVLVVGAVVLLAGAVRPVRAARWARHAVEQSLPDAIDLLVHAIRAGFTPHQAVLHLAEVAPAPVRPAFAAVAHRVQRGQMLPDALSALPERLGPAAAGVADVLAAGVRYGLPLAPVLDRLGNEARDARRRSAEADARRLPVRLSFPLVTCTLPSFVLLAIAPAAIATLSSLGDTAW